MEKRSKAIERDVVVEQKQNYDRVFNSMCV